MEGNTSGCGGWGVLTASRAEHVTINKLQGKQQAAH